MHESPSEQRILYTGFRDFLLSLGIDKPRVKIIRLPHRTDGRGRASAHECDAKRFDFSLLQCSETRVVAAGGICSLPNPRGVDRGMPIGGEPAGLVQTLPPVSPACVTCYHTGMTCRTFSLPAPRRRTAKMHTIKEYRRIAVWRHL
jgi:hypothetical protein